MRENFTNPVALSKVKVTDAFWGNYMELARTKMIPYQWDALNDRVEDAEPSHCVHNFRVAAGLEEGKFEGWVFQDSDLAKWIEGVAYSLNTYPDPELEQQTDELIEIIEKAQQPDGYLNTYYTINGLEDRWTNLRDNHEMYCAGHMLEAAVAYYHATGKDRLLNVMIRMVDHIASVFGPEGGKKKGYPGHEELELALVKLYEITKDPKHLALAKFFIDERGKTPNYFREEAKTTGECYFENGPLKMAYRQAEQPVRDQMNAEGHAVRAMYLYAGMASVAKETDDESLIKACERLWESTTQRQMYITGAVGSSEYGEAFTYDYDLPNDTIYGETCASIGLAMFARRMLELSPKGEYADIMEKALYNGVISGVSLEGNRFFYVNPLEIIPEACEKDWLRRHVKVERQRWFGCACCPPNIVRTVTSIGQYIYTKREDTLFVNLYVASSCETVLSGTPVKLELEGNYPWEGNLSFTISCEKTVSGTICLRIPAWCREWKLVRNGKEVDASVCDGYVSLDGAWNDKDRIELQLSMPVERMEANPLVREDIGKQAVMRGPIVYCLEEIDNGKNLHQIILPQNAEFTMQKREELLGGVIAIQCNGLKYENKDRALYQFAQDKSYVPTELHFVPYYAWNNRGIGEMTVWIRTQM